MRVEAYNNSFDQVAYQGLRLPEEAKKKEKLDNYTTRQIETHLGERFNTLLSTTNYEIRDGVIYGENMDEPFMESLVRGRNYRRTHGNPVDWPREAAEVMGFSKIEQFARTAPKGAMIASISKPGERESEDPSKKSIYQHNFIDIFTKKEGHIEARRYSTALNTSEYIAFARSQGLNVPGNPTDAYFLENPFVIKDFSTPDEVHKHLHREHEYMTEEEFSEIVSACAPLIISYINALASDDFDWQKISFNAILNRADDAYSVMKKGGRLSKELTRDEIASLGFRTVREVATGCGASAGFATTKGGVVPFSVSEFGSDFFGKRDFECPNCHATNIRPENTLLPACMFCGSPDVAC